VRARARSLLQAGPPGCSARDYNACWTNRCTTKSAKMRGNIKAQCLSKIERLKEEDGVDVK
jgi:hypothetical protein